ncbi:MAG: hypothetical protein ACQESN_09900 [Thermotogota bacterium]
MLKFFLLDNFKIYSGRKEIKKIHSKKAKEILKYLIINRNKKIPINELFELFWKETFFECDDVASLKMNLNTALYIIRKSLNISTKYLFLEFDSCLFNPKNIYVDTEDFVMNYHLSQETIDIDERIKYLLYAESLYKTDFLCENMYDSWVDIKREYFKNIYMNIINEIADIYMEKDDLNKALKFLEKAFQMDRDRDDLWIKQIAIYIRKDNYLKAQKLYEDYKDMFEEDNIDIIENFNMMNFAKKEGFFESYKKNTLSAENFNKFLEIEKRKRNKDFYVTELVIKDKSQLNDSLDKLIKFIREEDLICFEGNKIKIMFRELKDVETNKILIEKKLKKILNKQINDIKRII